MAKGIFVLPIDSPLPGTAAAGLYLGTPNTEAGYQAGLAMKQPSTAPATWPSSSAR